MTRMFYAMAVMAAVALTGIAQQARAHGDVTPQPVDVTGLEPLGEEWRKENPYKGDPTAIKIGMSGYNQNCARCHGIDGISGGIAPDLRFLEQDASGDDWFLKRVRHGATVNGTFKMPPFEKIMSQEAMWAIRSYLESRPTD